MPKKHDRIDSADTVDHDAGEMRKAGFVKMAAVNSDDGIFGRAGRVPDLAFGNIGHRLPGGTEDQVGKDRCREIIRRFKVFIRKPAGKDKPCLFRVVRLHGGVSGKDDSILDQRSSVSLEAYRILFL